jgi:uncharacterized lipoprotein YmbA
MTKSVLPPRGLVLLIASLCLTACVGTSAPTVFYQLQVSPSNILTTVNKGPVVGVGPVAVPEYLDRPQIVVRTGTSRRDISEFHRWVEPVADGIKRSLTIILANELVSNQVYWLPRSDTRVPLDFRVAIDLARFDGQFNEEVVLESRWTLFNKEDKPLLTRVTVIRQPISGTRYEALVAAMNQSLLSLGQEISAELKAYLK